MDKFESIEVTSLKSTRIKRSEWDKISSDLQAYVVKMKKEKAARFQNESKEMKTHNSH
jgi:hypothetical protein